MAPHAGVALTLRNWPACKEGGTAEYCSGVTYVDALTYALVFPPSCGLRCGEGGAGHGFRVLGAHPVHECIVLRCTIALRCTKLLQHARRIEFLMLPKKIVRRF